MTNYITKVGDYTYTAPNFDNIPQELKDIHRWVTWKAVKLADKEKPTKIPYDAKYPESTAKANTPETWSSFDEAMTSFEEGGRTGVGIVLNGDGLVGVDLDNCVTNRVISDEAKALLRKLNPQYVEFSPSGNGIRALGKANNLPKGINGTLNGVQIEMYSTGRYLTLTGDVIKNTGIWDMPGFNEVAQQIAPITPQLVAATNDGSEYVDLNRNNYLFQYASKLRRNIHDLNVVYQAVMAENMRVCRPPLAEAEIRATIMQTVSKYTPVEIEAIQTPQQAFSVDPDTGEVIFTEPKPVSLLEGTRIELDLEMRPVNWVINDIIPEGVGVIAGSAGAGKTTAVVPLALIATGFASHLDYITASIQRKLVVFTEDAGQIQRILYGVRKHMIRQDNQSVSFEQLSEMVHLYPSKRVNPKEMRAKIHEAIALHSVKHELLGAVPPLIIFDTAAANISLNDENSNSQVSESMAVLKEIYQLTNAPMWIIAHLTKTAKGASVDELDNFSARGGGAWEGDANWTALLGRDTNADNRSILRIDKERVGNLKGKEISFTLTLHQLWLTNQIGESVKQEYPVIAMEKQGAGERRKANASAKYKELEDKILAAVNVLSYPSARDIYDVVKGNKREFEECLQSMLIGFNGVVKLQKQALPKDMIKGAKRDFLSIPL